jgi:hypothetical protein
MLEGALLTVGQAENLCGATVCHTLSEKNERDQRIAEAGSSLVETGVMIMMIFSRIDVMAPIDTTVYLAGHIHRGAMAVQMIASVQMEDTCLPPHSVVVD